MLIFAHPPAVSEHHRHRGPRHAALAACCRPRFRLRSTSTSTQDRTTTIRASVHDVEVTLVISVVLVILVVFVFLRSVWATAIPSVAVPLSLVGTFGVMYLLGYTIDNLSLMALTISTGFVVDDAIVVIENITRYLEAGHVARCEAALRGSREIGFTVLSMSTSLIAVFIPILLMGGIVGRIFREFAVTLSVAVAISLVVSLTTTPMMCAKLLKPTRNERKHNWLYRASESGFQMALRRLRQQPALGAAAPAARPGRHRWARSAWPFISTSSIPKGFFPQQDTGRFNGNARASEDISFQTMQQKLAQYIAIVQSRSGRGHRDRLHRRPRSIRPTLNITLKPLSERKVSADQVINRLRPKLARVPGATLFLQPCRTCRSAAAPATRNSSTPCRATTCRTCWHWAPHVRAEAASAFPSFAT